jgi:nonsense-mediated mRNA decay protein 3
MIQLRKFGGVKKTFHALEAQLAKAKLFHLMQDIKVVKDGLDFYFRMKNQADKVLDLLMSIAPVRVSTSKKLISRDLHSNLSRYEVTIIVEIVPVNKGDLIVAPKALLGGHRELLLVTKISSLIHCIQPTTMQAVEFSASKYFHWTHTNLPVVVVAREKQLKPFLVLDIIPVASTETVVKETGGILAEAEVQQYATRKMCEVTSLALTSRQI